jgi:drug/metabolite transporter (DMT)-like permease
MIYLQFILGGIVHLLAAAVSYSTALKENSSLFFATGLLCTTISASLWFWIAHNESNSGSLVLKGLYWDLMQTAAYLIIPFIVHAAHKNLNIYQMIGIALVFLGLIFVKIG